MLKDLFFFLFLLRNERNVLLVEDLTAVSFKINTIEAEGSYLGILWCSQLFKLKTTFYVKARTISGR